MKLTDFLTEGKQQLVQEKLPYNKSDLAPDYEHDKAKYLNNIWRIINWDAVNIRLT